MVLQVGTLNRNTLEPFKSWRFEQSGCKEGAILGVSSDVRSASKARQCSRHHADCPSKLTHEPGLESRDDGLQQRLQCLANSPTSNPPGRPACCPSDSRTKTSSALTGAHQKYTFELSRKQTPLKVDKRRRAESDVDGPHTAALSSKKRRLRLHLITSRLSQPFSLPATHIINRDGAASGDKRFVKLAAVATSPDPSKLGLNREGSVMLRAAVLNRVRLRVRNEATHRGDHVVAVAARNAAVLHHGAQLATGARFVAPSTALACHRKKQPPSRVFLMRPGGSSSPAPGSASTQAERLSPPGTTQASRPLTKSPCLKPTRSPLSISSETLLEEMGDDGSVAFPMTEEECHYAWADDDDMEDVYSDFEVIFGGLASNEDDGSYEEYLDELDGIAWVDR